jgi:COP9 signalosome complex subunit 12
MDSLFNDFGKAIKAENGYLLAETLSPITTGGNADWLRAIWSSTNHHSVKDDVKRGIQGNISRSSLSFKQVQGWVEVYAAYWRAVGEILAAEDPTTSSRRVSTLAPRLSEELQ